jgi:TolB-like protein
MMALKKLSLLIGLVLSGCSMLDPKNGAVLEDYDLVESSPQNNLQQSEQGSSPLKSSLRFQKQFKAKLTAQQQGSNVSEYANIIETSDHYTPSNGSGAKHNINHYAQGLMQDLIANLHSVNANTPIAVVSFVMLDSDYNQSSILGNQMAESLIHEVHKFGIPVIDYKTTGFIRVTEQGDFAFSKDYEDFGNDLAVLYIVGGTLLRHEAGYLVNARVVDIKTKAVVASAQSFIPNDIADALLTRQTSVYQGTGKSQTSPRNTVSLIGSK